MVIKVAWYNLTFTFIIFNIGNGFECDNLNECIGEVRSACSPNAFCLDLIGTFECTCLTGFSGDGAVCEDINECEVITSFTAL